MIRVVELGKEWTFTFVFTAPLLIYFKGQKTNSECDYRIFWRKKAETERCRDSGKWQVFIEHWWLCVCYSYIGQRWGTLRAGGSFVFPQSVYIALFLIFFSWECYLCRNNPDFKEEQEHNQWVEIRSWHLSADILIDLAILVFKILVVISIQRTRIW